MKEKTAEEMFEELGYKLVSIYNNTISYGHNKEESFVDFNLFSKDYKVAGEGYYGDAEGPFSVSILLHQAITKQMQELGWI